MSAQGLEVIDETVQHTHEWINELAERIETPDRRRALRLLRAVLAAIRDHLGHDEAARLSAQLPLLIRGFYWEGWRPAATPVHPSGADAFLAAVGARYDPGQDVTLAEDVEEVFRLLNHRVSAGEIDDLRRALPEDLRALWPA